MTNAEKFVKRLKSDIVQSAKGCMRIIESEGYVDDSQSIRTAANLLRQMVKDLDTLDGAMQALYWGDK